MSNLNSKVTSQIGLRDVDTENWAPGLVELAESTAGVASFLYQMISGGGVDGKAPAVPLNPQGRVGVDHSGPPYGSALKHPIATWGGIPDNSAFDLPGAGYSWLELTSSNGIVLNFFVWVRPFHEHPGAPYSRGYFDLRMGRASGSGAITVACALVQQEPGPMPLQDTNITSGEQVTNLTVSTTTKALFDLDADGDASAFFVDLVPGPNYFQLRLTSDDIATATIEVTGVTLNQVAKRRHA